MVAFYTCWKRRNLFLYCWKLKCTFEPNSVIDSNVTVYMPSSFNSSHALKLERFFFFSIVVAIKWRCSIGCCSWCRSVLNLLDEVFNSVVRQSKVVKVKLKCANIVLTELFHLWGMHKWWILPCCRYDCSYGFSFFFRLCCSCGFLSFFLISLGSANRCIL